MKAFTNFEQSKKLTEILPLESADMVYLSYTNLKTNTVEYDYPSVNIDGIEGLDVPCWSLTALLSTLPEPELIQNSEGTWLLRVWYNRYPYSVGGYTNPIDACYEMIIKFKEKNLL